MFAIVAEVLTVGNIGNLKMYLIYREDGTEEHEGTDRCHHLLLIKEQKTAENVVEFLNSKVNAFQNNYYSDSVERLVVEWEKQNPRPAIYQRVGYKVPCPVIPEELKHLHHEEKKTNSIYQALLSSRRQWEEDNKLHKKNEEEKDLLSRQIRDEWERRREQKRFRLVYSIDKDSRFPEKQSEILSRLLTAVYDPTLPLFAYRKVEEWDE